MCMIQVRPSTGTTDLKESLQLNYHDMEGLWPSDEDCPGFKDQSLKFMELAHEVSLKILSCFAIALGFPENFFESVGLTSFLNPIDCCSYHMLDALIPSSCTP